MSSNLCNGTNETSNLSKETSNETSGLSKETSNEGSNLCEDSIQQMFLMLTCQKIRNLILNDILISILMIEKLKQIMNFIHLFHREMEKIKTRVNFCAGLFFAAIA